MASMLACSSTQPIAGVLAFGYPFHPPGKPDKLRTDHFADITKLGDGKISPVCLGGPNVQANVLIFQKFCIMLY